MTNSVEKSWIARDVVRALDRRHTRVGMQRHQWAFVTELRVGVRRPEYSSREVHLAISPETYDPREDYDTRIDAFAMRVDRPHTVAYEVKVNRQDFLEEVANPGKRMPAMSLSNELYFAAPGGLIQPEEVPEDCGLIECYNVKRNGMSAGTITRIVVPAPWRQIDELPWTFIASLAMRAS